MDYKSNINGSDGYSSERSTINLPKWVTKKSIASDVEYLTTAILKQNKIKYKWFIYFHNGNVAWGYH